MIRYYVIPVFFLCLLTACKFRKDKTSNKSKEIENMGNFLSQENDSVTVKTHVQKKIIKINPQLIVDKYDSIRNIYKYNDKNNLRIISQDTFHYKIEKHFSDDKRIRTTLLIYSRPFQFQGFQCRWEYVIDRYKHNKNFYTQNMLAENNRIIMDGSGLDDKMYTSNWKELFHTYYSDSLLNDINFDGNGDILIDNKVKSGSAGNFFDAYIYIPKKNIYEYSQFLSGYYLEVNKKDSILSSMSRAGAGLYYFREIHFYHSGIEYIREFRSDRESNNEGEAYYIYSYRKKRNKKIIENKVDTIYNPSQIDFWKWKKNF